MKIKTRVKIAGALAFCVILAYGAWILHVNRTFSRITREGKGAQELVNRIFLLRALTYDYLAYPTERAQRQWSALYAELLRLLGDPEYQELQKKYGLEDTQAKLKTVSDTFSRLRALQNNSRQNVPEAETRRELQNRLTTQLLLAAQDLVTRTSQMTEEINEKLISTQRRDASMDILVLLALGVIIISAGVFLQRSVVKPVLKLQEGTEIIGGGNLDYKVGINTRDEIGQLSQAFDLMTANLRQVTVSRDELTKENEERKRAEEALRLSAERLDLLAETAGRLLAAESPQQVVDSLCRKVMDFLDCDAFFNFLVTDEKAGFMQLNACAGIPEEEAKEIHFLEYGVAVCGCAARDACRIVAEDIQHTPDPRTELVKSYGIQAYACHPLMVEGRVLGTLSFGTRKRTSFAADELGLMKAVADQVAIAMARKLAEEALRESEEHYRSLFEHMLDGFAYCRMHFEGNRPVDFTYLKVNESFETLTGLKNVTGKKVSEVIPGIRETNPELLEVYGRVALTGKPERFEYYLDALKMWFWLSVYSPQKEYFVAVFDVITARKQAEEKLQAAMRDLERSNRDLEEFAYISSHDLQEPLRKIANFSEMLAEQYRGRLDEDANRYFGYITDGAKRMQALINDLLSYSRVGRGMQSLLPVNMEEVLQGTLNDLQPLVLETKTQITHDPLPTLRINPFQMGQLLQNLIANAIKFHGDQPPRIHISARQDGGEWLFAVRDQGIGFDPQHAERIFKVFQRLHSKEKYQGTGIGLAICKKIAERHGGRCWAESQPGQGSTFYFTIPV